MRDIDEVLAALQEHDVRGQQLMGGRPVHGELPRFAASILLVGHETSMLI